MPSGNRDGFDPGQVSSASGGGAVNELAARLGSIVLRHRGGNVIFIEDFEDSLSRWRITLNGALATITQDALISFRGASSAKFTGDSADPDENRIEQRLAGLVTKKMGLSFWFRVDSVAFILEAKLIIRNALEVVTYGVELDHVANDISLFSGVTSTTQIIGDMGYIATGHDWHNIKIVINTEDGTYNSFCIDGDEIDVSGVTVTKGVAAVGNRTIIRIGITN